MARTRRSASRAPVMLTDPRAIKALAHPARLAVLDELFAGRRLTATECAEIAGLSPSAMSYHLRALEKWGIVERAEASEDGRERPWQAAGAGLRIESAEPGVSAVAETMLMTRILDRARSDLRAWMAHMDAAQKPWHEITTVASGGAWMTEDEATEVAAAILELIDRYRRPDADGRAPGARRVRMSFVLVPVDESDG